MTFEQRPEGLGEGDVQIPFGESIQAEGKASAVATVSCVYLNVVWWQCGRSYERVGEGRRSRRALQATAKTGFPFDLSEFSAMEGFEQTQDSN